MMMRIFVDYKSTDHAKPHFNLLFPEINAKENVLFRLRAEKSFARHIDTSSVVWTLIEPGKLANHLTRLAIVVKKYIFIFN